VLEIVAEQAVDVVDDLHRSETINRSLPPTASAQFDRRVKRL
jgi:hypothetical protein